MCAEVIEFLRRTANCDFVEFLPLAVYAAPVKFPQLAACFVVRAIAMEFLSFAARIVAVEFQRFATRGVATKFLLSGINAALALLYDASFD